MASTPAVELAQEVVESCFQYGTWPSRALDALIERALDEADSFVAAAATRALFTVIIERLADSFEPELCEVYARLFAQVISRAIPDFDADELSLRYRRISQPRRFVGGEVNRVFVLSRVTLGADIAVTSVVLDAMKDRFPEAEICFAGPAKNAELFTGDSRIVPVSIPYRRSGTLRERLKAASELKGLLDEAGTLVIDPDSRLTQLGLIPVCDDARYYFFESRAYGGSSDANLSALTAEWLSDVFAIAGARPYVAPPPGEPMAEICVSWGVGENEDKRISDAFEEAVTKELVGQGSRVMLDCGAGGEEAERARQLQARLNAPNLSLYQGPYAGFARQIVQSKLYVGYDSVGQHVASAAQVPLVSIFTGYSCGRMLARWSPSGQQARVIAVLPEMRDGALAQTLEAIESLSAQPEPACR